MSAARSFQPAPVSVAHPCFGMSPKAHETFLAIAMGLMPEFHPRALVALLDRRLIKRTGTRVAGRLDDNQVILPVYGVVPAMYDQWLAWLDENPSKP